MSESPRCIKSSVANYPQIPKWLKWLSNLAIKTINNIALITHIVANKHCTKNEVFHYGFFQ